MPDKAENSIVSGKPALSWLLRDADTIYGPNGVECTDGWSRCPFCSEVSYEEREGYRIDNDPSEAHYDCSLLKEKVWGEYPQCTEAQWREKARSEYGS